MIIVYNDGAGFGEHAAAVRCNHSRIYATIYINESAAHFYSPRAGQPPRGMSRDSGEGNIYIFKLIILLLPRARGGRRYKYY